MEQLALAFPGVKDPAGQCWQSLARSPEKRPGGQGRHAVACIPENLPGGQFVQFLVCSYVPGRHAMHWESTGVAQTQLDVPGGQGLQSWLEAPVVLSRNVWNGQSWHACDPSGANLPNPQGTHRLAPTPLIVPLGHVRQASIPVWGVCLPASQSSHCSSSLYLPVWQAEQAKMVCAPV